MANAQMESLKKKSQPFLSFHTRLKRSQVHITKVVIVNQDIIQF